MRRQLQLILAVVALLGLQTANGQQALSLGSAFPGDDTGDAASATPSPPAATTPSPPAATSPSLPAATTSPSPAAASSPPAAVPSPAAGAPVKAPTPAPANAPAKAPAPGPAGALAGAPAPSSAALATGGADIKPAAAPAPGPTAAPQIDIIYIQQANNARMTPSPTDPNSGVLTLNGAIDTSLYVQDVPIRKLGKTSSQSFLNANTPAPGTTQPAGPPQWFAPAPTAILLGFNTTNHVYILMTLSAPTYNYTIATISFNYLLQSPTLAAAANATNSWVVNFYADTPNYVSSVESMTNITKEATIFTPSLLTSITCGTNPVVPKGSCTTAGGPGTPCATATQHGTWINGTFCA